MNTSIKQDKFELLQWLSNLKDEAILKQVIQIKTQTQTKPKQRVAGSGKMFFSNISEDFNDSLDDIFKDYLKS